ncbi:glycosyltransferase [Panacibacter ginsenosidivorans]|uniref:Glycosyltransferase n=1 Tax=Panacibacter ginsenosidivorans TaxID=1813871 RepID=A0A5B8V417_9BACT|nr:glycosyltransferase [Panacibacter ginsenosidivorans]QEC65952.1 glycosyltransferase [Panacibacter ginsenosidivorans]
MKYSIILPVRNGGEYVKECVNSILTQELNNFNLHVLDNCSTDGTLQWIESLNDSRIFTYPSSKSLSIEDNWGRIKDIPKNEFITLIGHDDVLEKNYLSVMDELIKKHPDACLYQTHFRYIDAQSKCIKRCKPMDEVQSASEFLALFLCNIIDANGTGFMMRSKDYDTLGGIPTYPNLLFADFELWINASLIGYKATAFEECFAFRLHQSTTSTSADIKMQLAFNQFINYLEQLKSKNLLLKAVIERYGVDFISFYSKGLAHRLMRTPKNKRNGESVVSFLEQCKLYADRLVPGNSFNPVDNFSVKLATYIDSNAVTRGLFLAFKKIYSKPVLS